MNGYLNNLVEYYRAVGGAVGDGVAGDGAGVVMRAASAGDVFGDMSQRAAGMTEGWPLTAGFADTTLFHAVVLLLLVCYVLVLYREPELLKSLHEHIFSTDSGREEHMNDNRNDSLRGFSWSRLLLDTLFVCTAVVWIADTLAPASAGVLPPPARMLVVPMAAGMFFATMAYQSAVLALTGAVTVSQPLTAALLRIKAIYFRLASVTLTPVLLLCVLSPSGNGGAFAAVIALLVLFVVLAFLRETFLLFISKKLSIYHWFLYLCTVEAFPISFFCLLAVRG